MSFTNPILAGLTLIRQAIRSPDYMAGQSGWSINRDGSAEFSNATLRGQVRIGDQGDGVLQPGGVRILPQADVPAEIQAKYTPFGINVCAAVIYRAAGFWYWWEAVCIHPTDANQHFIASGVHAPDGTVVEVGRKKYVSGTGPVTTIENGAFHSIESGGILVVQPGGNANVSGALHVLSGGTATVDAGATATVNGTLSVPGTLDASGVVFHTAYSGTTDASGFLTVTHGAPWTPVSGWAMTTNPNSSFAQAWGIDSFTSTTCRLRFTSVASTGVLASTAVQGRLFLVK